MLESLSIFVIAVLVLVAFGLLAMVARWYHKAQQGSALVRTGVGGTNVSFSGMMVVPVIHQLETMDISLKTVMISRQGKDGLVCKDNLRADIQVTFFVRVNNTHQDVLNVAQSIGCERASDPAALEALFDAKFSEALKSVGKHFEFVELYNAREAFREKIIEHIGTDLNGYVLDDCAIDYLEQTPLETLNERNILDAEGIKKITELTAAQKVLANQIERDKEKTIKQQDVEAREAVLELERQLAETQERQQREIAMIRAREEAETSISQEQERLRAERARIQREEETDIAEENMKRQVIVARKSKERTEAIENERVDKDRRLERTEKDRIVALAEIAKEKALEEERRDIQETIRERVAVQKSVVEEEERIKDTQALAEAERQKSVAIKEAEMRAEEALVERLKQAEAEREAAEFRAKQLRVEADAEQATAGQRAESIKVMADAEAAKAAALGLAEAQVMEAKAAAKEKEGEAQASVTEDAAAAEASGIRARAEAQAEADLKIGQAAASVTRDQGLADAEVIRARADALEQQGLAEAKVSSEKYRAEAEGVAAKAEAMQKLDGVGKEHEEFKLRLEKEKDVEMAGIQIEQHVAEAQAKVLAEALKAARIDIVGGEGEFFEKISRAVGVSKSLDRAVDHGHVLAGARDALFGGNGQSEDFRRRLRQLIEEFGVSSEDLKNLSVAALLLRLRQSVPADQRDFLSELLATARDQGLADRPASLLGL